MSRSTDPPPLRRRSGSIPHDAVAIDPRPQRRPSFLLALGLQCPRFRRSARSARSHTANLLAQRAIRLFTPTRTPTLQRKAIGSAASLQRPQHSRRGQIPIAPAAPSLPHTPRFRALALFGRWPPQRVDGLGIPASENLHRRRHLAMQQETSLTRSPLDSCGTVRPSAFAACPLLPARRRRIGRSYGVSPLTISRLSMWREPLDWRAPGALWPKRGISPIPVGLR